MQVHVMTSKTQTQQMFITDINIFEMPLRHFIAAQDLFTWRHWHIAHIKSGMEYEQRIRYSWINIGDEPCDILDLLCIYIERHE